MAELGNDNTAADEIPITVSSSALPAVIATILRYVLTAAGTLMLTKGYLPADLDITEIVGGIVALAAAAYGAWKAKVNNSKMQTMAAVLPDEIAKIR